jgi:hypothetical protein
MIGAFDNMEKAASVAQYPAQRGRPKPETGQRPFGFKALEAAETLRFHSYKSVIPWRRVIRSMGRELGHRLNRPLNPKEMESAESWSLKVSHEVMLATNITAINNRSKESPVILSRTSAPLRTNQRPGNSQRCLLTEDNSRIIPNRRPLLNKIQFLCIIS